MRNVGNDYQKIALKNIFYEIQDQLICPSSILDEFYSLAALFGLGIVM